MPDNGPSGLEILDEALRLYSPQVLADKLGVEPNQINVWRSRGRVSAQARLKLDALLRSRAAEAEKTGDAALAALKGHPDLLGHLVRQTEYLARIPALQAQIEELRATVSTLEDQLRMKREQDHAEQELIADTERVAAETERRRGKRRGRSG